MRRLAILALLTLTATALRADHHRGGSRKPPHQAISRAISHAVAVLHPTEGSRAQGVVHFRQELEGVRVDARVEGLEGGRHGFHVHLYGDCSSPDGVSAGGHFNPGRYSHGGPNSARRHAGDLGNLFATQEGVAVYGRVDTTLTLMGEDTILGRGVIVHTAADDLRSQPTGRAGARVACGVIGISQP